MPIRRRTSSRSPAKQACLSFSDVASILNLEHNGCEPSGLTIRFSGLVVPFAFLASRTGREVPHAHSPVGAARRELLAVGAIRDGIHVIGKVALGPPAREGGQ